MPAPSSDKKTVIAGDKAKTKIAQRKRVLKHGSDGDVVRAFANKKGKAK